MNKIEKLIAAVVVFAVPALGIACDYPERPTLPDGNTASKDEMIAAQTAVKTFLAGVDEYLECIEQEEKEAIEAMPEIDESDEEAVAERDEAVKRRDELLSKRFDAANDAVDQYEPLNAALSQSQVCTGLENAFHPLPIQ